MHKNLFENLVKAARWVILFVMIISTAATATPALACDCSAYNYNVGLTGVVSVTNNSNSYEGAQSVDVYIDGEKVAVMNVPALGAGKSAVLGTVATPDNGSFTWKVDGSKNCIDEGSYHEVNSDPTTCEDLELVTLKTEEDWVQDIWRGKGPYTKNFTKPENATLALVNTGWEWTGGLLQFQRNEIHTISSTLGTTTSMDYGNEELAGKTVWFDVMSGAAADLELVLSFAGDNSSPGSHNSHAIVSWCGDKPVDPVKHALYVLDYNDGNGDGTHDEGEELLSDWAIDWEYGNATHSLHTLPESALVGMFTAGETITLTKMTKEGWTDSTPNTVTVTMPDSDLTVEFGNFKPVDAKFNLYVLDYKDVNKDGVRSAEEELLSGWTVNWEFGSQTHSLDTYSTKPALVGQFNAGEIITLTKMTKEGWIDSTPNTVEVKMPNNDVLVEFGNYYTLPTFSAVGNCEGGSFKTENFSALDVSLWAGTGIVPVTNQALLAVQATEASELLGTWNKPEAVWTWQQMKRSSMNYTWLLYKAQGTDTRGHTYYFNQVLPLMCKSQLYLPIMCTKTNDDGEPECVTVYWQSGTRPINGSIGYTEPLRLWINNTGNWTNAWWQVQVDGKNIINTFVACDDDVCEVTLPGPFKPGGLLTGAIQLWPDGEFTNCPFSAHVDP